MTQLPLSKANHLKVLPPPNCTRGLGPSLQAWGPLRNIQELSHSPSDGCTCAERMWSFSLHKSLNSAIYIYLHRIFIVLGVISNLEVIENIWKDICRLYANNIMFIFGMWILLDFGIGWGWESGTNHLQIWGAPPNFLYSCASWLQSQDYIRCCVV